MNELIFKNQMERMERQKLLYPVWHWAMFEKSTEHMKRNEKLSQRKDEIWKYENMMFQKFEIQKIDSDQLKFGRHEWYAHHSNRSFHCLIESIFSQYEILFDEILFFEYW
jgi:hypothetical protein